MKRIILALFLLFWAGSVFAATYYVGPGQTYTTFAAFHAAVTPSPGDVVDGGGNTFTEQVAVNCSGSASGGYITYQNFKINGSGQSIDFGITTYDGSNHHTYLKFINIEVCNISYGGGSNDTGIYLTAANYTDETHNQVIDCIVHDVDLDYNSVGIRSRGRYNRIEGCIIYNIGGDAIYAAGSHFTMVGCKIYNIGIDYSVRGADGIQCGYDCTDYYITNNDISIYNGYKNTKQCIIISQSGAESNGTIENNTLTGFLGGNSTNYNNLIYLYGNFTVRYNTLQDGTYGMWVTNTGSNIIYYNYLKNIDRTGIYIALTADAKIYNNTIKDIVNTTSDLTNRGCIAIGSSATATIKNNICENAVGWGLYYYGSGGVTADYNSFYGCTTADYTSTTELQGSHDKHQISAQIDSSGFLISGNNCAGAGETQSIHGAPPDWIADYNRRPVVSLPPDIGMATYSPVSKLKQGSSIMEIRD